MATATTDLDVFTGAPPAPPPRPRVLLAGTTLAAGSAAMVVLTLIAIYARLRSDVIESGEVWLPEGSNLQLTPGSMGMATLALSLVTVAWIVQALRNDDRGHALWPSPSRCCWARPTSTASPTAGSSSGWASPARPRRCSSTPSPACTWP